MPSPPTHMTSRADSIRPFFNPRSVAVVGASRDPEAIGHRIVVAIRDAKFNGRVYPVNPKAKEIAGLRAFPDLASLPDAPDLAVVAVPAAAVPEVVEACAARGVRALVVISAGFAETGDEGRALQRQVLEQVRGFGMRMIGPNCLGILTTDPHVRLNASFSSVFPPQGNVAMASQSGALGLSILLTLARERQFGLSSFVSLGNKADVSSNDLIEYWVDDPRTDVILLYLESFGNPRHFARLARSVARNKSIIAVKSGRTTSGQRAAGSHTAALAASDVAVDALFGQTGVIRAATIDDMFHLAAAISSQPLPKGRRVAIVTNAGGPGILAADACQTRGLEVVELAPGTRETLAAFLPAAASVTNPVDMIASAGADAYRRAVETVLGASEVDALIVIYIPIGRPATDAVDRAIADGVDAVRAGSGAGKPVFACLMAGEDARPPVPIQAQGERIPAYTFPEPAARALASMADHADWRAAPAGRMPEFDNLDIEAARAIVAQALALRGDGWLGIEETRGLLSAFGMPVAPGGVATSADDAARLAEAVGYPVALKLASDTIVHKTDIGGVRLELEDEAAVRSAFDAILAAVNDIGQTDAMEGVLVQPMIRGGVEVLVGMTEDPVFGPLIAFGLGGIHVEILADVAFRVTPLTDRDAREMVRAIRGYRLLEGYRGHAAADVAAIEELLLRVGRLVEELPEISELDLNPVFAQEDGCAVVDARIRVSARAPGRDDRRPRT